MLSCDEYLDKLTATVNGTLIEAGHFFRSSGSLQSHERLKNNLPAVNEEFQTALDYLSRQIFLAKAVLEQDYESILAKKAHGQSAQSASESAQTDQQMVDSESTRPDASAPQPSPSMEPVAIATTDASTHVNKSVAVSGDEDSKEGSKPNTDPAASQARANLSTTPQNVNYSSVRSFDSLLPGLETYANTSSENPTTTNQANSGSRAPEGHDGHGTQMEDMPQPESNFENMFIGMDFGDGEDLLNNVEIGELDDAWFA
ncbi:hypothetical protein VTO42DRAFT_5467 [Malbranchea cinnamomea]